MAARPGPDPLSPGTRVAASLASAALCALLLLATACGGKAARDGAVDGCIRAVEAAVASDAGDRAARAAAGCASLYAEPACRSAHERVGEGDPSQKARLLAERCAHAYCGALAAPKPSLCAGVPAASPLELAPAWAELRHAIWLRDLGEDATARLEAALGAVASRAAPPPLPPSPLPPRPVIVVGAGAVTVDGAEVARVDDLAAAGRVARVVGLYEALARRRLEGPPGDHSAILQVAPDVPALVVKSVVQTATFAGYTDVAFAVGTPAEDGGTPP